MAFNSCNKNIDIIDNLQCCIDTCVNIPFCDKYCDTYFDKNAKNKCVTSCEYDKNLCIRSCMLSSPLLNINDAFSGNVYGKCEYKECGTTNSVKCFRNKRDKIIDCCINECNNIKNKYNKIGANGKIDDCEKYCTYLYSIDNDLTNFDSNTNDLMNNLELSKNGILSTSVFYKNIFLSILILCIIMFLLILIKNLLK